MKAITVATVDLRRISSQSLDQEAFCLWCHLLIPASRMGARYLGVMSGFDQIEMNLE